MIANDGETRFGAALDVIYVPVVHSRLAFVMSTVVGHLFGYEAALAIDSQARPLREARAAIEGLIEETRGGLSGDEFLARIEPSLAPVASQFMDGLRVGAYNGHLEAGTAVQLASRFRYALGTAPLDSYQVEFGKVGTPSVVIEDLSLSLAAAIDELTRPVDAIKHQAKTVTVGISRTDETLLEFPLVAAVLEAGAPRDGLSYATIRTLANLDPAVAEVVGWTRYVIDEALTTRGPSPSSIAAACRRRSRAEPTSPRRYAVPKSGWRRSARSCVRRACRRSSDHHGPRDQGQRDHRHDLAPHRVPRSPGARGDAWRAPGLSKSVQPLHGAVTETEDTFRIDQLGRKTSVSSCGCRSRSSQTAGGDDT